MPIMRFRRAAWVSLAPVLALVLSSSLAAAQTAVTGRDTSAESVASIRIG